MAKLRFPLLIILLLLGVTLRVWDFPHRYEPRHADEENYMIGSLHLLEGMVPPFKYAPAGPQTWAGWTYAGALSARDFFFPPSHQGKLDIRLRPFFAVNDAMWDTYADESMLRWIWILAAYPFVIWAIYEAFMLGERLGGLAGAVLLSGVSGTLPLFVELTNQSRPYMLAWALAIIAISLVVRAKTHRGVIVSAIFFGLAIGSRIDMLMLLPIAWSEIWQRRKQDHWVRSLLVYNFVALIALLLIAPWILTSLIGNLRIIGTVRLSEAPQGPISKLHTLLDVVWAQGVLIVPLLALAGTFLRRQTENRPRWLLNLFLLFLVFSMLKATGFGLQHQGGPIIAMLFLAAMGIGALWRIFPIAGVALAALLVVLPLIRSVQGVITEKRMYAPEDAVAWIEQHVPPGTRVYTESAIRSLLPTVAASNTLWAEVNDGDAWQKKFVEGMERFHLDASEIPRALSDEDNLVERGQRRKWFILGSRGDVPRPRYDIRIYRGSPIFGVMDLPAAFARSGGIILWRGSRSDPEVAGLTPVIGWPSRYEDVGVYIYSQDVKLLD